MEKKKKKKPVKYLSPDQVRFNRVAQRQKGKPGSIPYKRYVFGHLTNVRKGRV